MTTEIQSHRLGSKNWPSVIHLMRGDILRVSGVSDQNGVMMTLSISGGRGTTSTTEQNWNLQWVTGEGRESYTVRLLRKAGVAPELQIAETKVVLHDRPPVRVMPDSEDIFIKFFRVESEIPVPYQSVEWTIDEKSVPTEDIVKGRCAFPLNGVLPGSYRLGGRVRFADNQGFVALAPITIDVPDIMRVKVNPDRKSIDLTSNPGLTEVAITIEPMVKLPKDTLIGIRINDQTHTLPTDNPVLRLDAAILSNQEFRVSPAFVQEGKRREGAVMSFTVVRDIPEEVRRLLATMQELPVDRIRVYLRESAAEKSTAINLSKAQAAMNDLQTVISRCNAILVPVFLPESMKKSLGEYQAIRREILALSRRFLQAEIVFWQAVTNEAGVFKGQLPALVAARSVPIHPSVGLQKILEVRLAQDADAASKIIDWVRKASNTP